MLEFVYQANPVKGKYKSLGYAIPLTNALSGNLSVNLRSRLKGSLSTSTRMESVSLTGGGLENHTEQVHGHGSSLAEAKVPDLIMTGKQLPSPKVSGTSNHVLRRMHVGNSPILLIPYGYKFNGIQNVLFTGHGKCLMDEPLLHHLMSVFLPKAWYLHESGPKRIHWNNVSLLPHVSSFCNSIPVDTLDHWSQHNAIDLLLTPVPMINNRLATDHWTRRMIAQIQIPILIFPSKTLNIQPEVLAGIDLPPLRLWAD